MTEPDKEKEHIDISTLKEGIRSVLQNYRREYGYVGGQGMTERDVYNIVQRLGQHIHTSLDEMDTHYVDYLEKRVDELEDELRLAQGDGYPELKREYEWMRSLVKELIYQMGEEDGAVIVAKDHLEEKASRVRLNLEDRKSTVAVRVEEYED